METRPCPECMSSIPFGAKVCSACGERIEGVRCGECQALAPHGARKCRWCGNRLGEIANPDLEGFEVVASRLASLLIRGVIFPQKAFFSTEKIVIRTPSTFGLTSNEEEILWEKVAGFTQRNGIFWDRIAIETRGQSTAVITCLRKHDSQRIRQVLQGLER
ncbi:MAG: zinc ribbon domain-containing protein [Planctomycetes bacterium]|nr:zinc ribbon domain-containing protein [Planctomycetota bacterium]